MSDTEHPGRGMAGQRPFVFFHIGDLHLTKSQAGDPATVRRRNKRIRLDLKRILHDIAQLDPGCFDFVYLPGDIAQNGLAAEYRILTSLLRQHKTMPLRLIPGDHDRQFGRMVDFAAFRAKLRFPQRQGRPVWNLLADLPRGPRRRPAMKMVKQYYYAQTYRGVHCLFLDMVSAGFGRKGFGLDFRLGDRQLRWLTDELALVKAAGIPAAVFAHAYPDDIRDAYPTAAQQLAGLFWDAGVRLVEMGHTHYNELGFDGRTVYAAARSVGQNEDGPVGHAVAAIDGDAVSWRFKPLQNTWPFVLITSPADRRLATAPSKVVGGMLLVRAVALADRGRAGLRCDYRVDTGPWRPMVLVDGICTFQSVAPWPAGSRSLSVRARILGQSGFDAVDVDTIEPAGLTVAVPSFPARPGSDAQAIPGPWPVKGIRGDQLGPNRTGRQW